MEAAASVRGKRPGKDNFPRTLAADIRRRAEIGMQAYGGTQGAQRHAQALRALAACVDEAPLDDPRISGLWFVSATFGPAEDYTPGSEQAKVLSQVGTSPGVPIPSPTDMLSELLFAAVEDLHDQHRSRERAAHDQAIAADAKAADLEAAQTRAQELEGLLGAANARIAELENDVAKGEEALSYWQESGLPAPRSKKKVVA